jgi:hypothetical protein
LSKSIQKVIKVLKPLGGGEEGEEEEEKMICSS